jgi:hypothetical protein
MSHQAFAVSLGEHGVRRWIAVFYHGREPVAVAGTPQEPTPWRAVQRAAWDVPGKAERWVPARVNAGRRYGPLLALKIGNAAAKWLARPLQVERSPICGLVASNSSRTLERRFAIRGSAKLRRATPPLGRCRHSAAVPGRRLAREASPLAQNRSWLAAGVCFRGTHPYEPRT